MTKSDEQHRRDRQATGTPGGGSAGDWKQLVRRIARRMRQDRLGVMSAGVGFYAMLCLFPALIALVSVYGLLFDPEDLQGQLDALAGSLPDALQEILEQHLGAIVQSAGGDLSLTLCVSLIVSFWAASTGIKGLMQAVAATYGTRETRSVIHVRLTSIALTAGAMLAFVLVVALITTLPIVFRALGWGESTQAVIGVLRWVLLGAIAIGFLAVLYRRAPDRRPTRFRWVSWGAAIATGLWLLASFLLSVYLDHFGAFARTYGSLGTVVALMIWLWISAFTILLGAEVNVELERRTSADARHPEGSGEGE